MLNFRIKSSLREIALDAATLILAVAAGLVLAGVLKDLLLLATGRDRELHSLLAFLTANSGIDSWMPLFAAVDLFRSNPDAGIYETVFFDQQTKFQYPPMSLLPFVGLSALGMSSETGTKLMQLLCFLGMLGIIAVGIKMALDLRALPGLQSFSRRPGAIWMVIGGTVVATLTFYPIVYAFELGQIQVLIDLAVAGALLLFMKDKKRFAGALMAVATLIKPQYGLVLLWALLRREHRFTVGFLGVGVPAGLASLAVFGLAEHFSYLSVLSYIGRHGELYWANQSVNGLLNRLVHMQEDALTWNGRAFAPYSGLVYFGTLATTAALIAVGLLFRPGWTRTARSDERSRAALGQENVLDFATAVTALTLASPVAWEHHYGVTLPIMLLALAVLIDLRARRPDRTTLTLLVGLAAAYWLISNYFTQLMPVVGTPLNVLQSYGLFGGLALLATLVGARQALNPDRATAGRTAAA